MAAPTTGLIAHWPFDEGSGPLAADPAGGYTATLANGATWTAGRFRAGVELDGFQGYVAPPIIDVSGSALTLAAWVKVASYASDSDQRIISKAAGTGRQAQYWTLSHVRSGRRNVLSFRLRAGGATTTLTASKGILPANTWFHAAATYDGATMRLYLNGVEVAHAAKAGAIATNPLVPVDIGRSPDGSNHLRGAIDEVRIYERALPVEEIADVMEDSGGPAGDTAPPSVPGNVQATAQSSSAVAVQWNASTDESGVAGYRVKRNGVAVAAVPGTTYTDTGLAAATTYSYTVAAFDDAGNESADSAAVSVTTLAGAPPPNQVPTVTLTAPANGATFTAPAAVTITASAADPENRLADVRFYAGGSLLATDATAPYSFTWSSVPAGTYSITAVARDSDGGTATSGAAGITVRSANQPPTVTVSAPLNGATYTAPASVTITASAADPENRLADVRFYAGGTLLATDATAPYSFTWPSVPAGTYSITAVARDSDGGTATSGAVGITVRPPNQVPSVTLSAPANGAAFLAPAIVTITASASDPENRLADVRFYVGTVLLGTDTTAPYSFTWLSVPAGTYSITAVARDSDGGTATSGAVGITVTPVVSSPWRVAYTASTDHATNVTSYLLEVFASGADPNTATPQATSDLGKPTPDANSEIVVDRTTFFEALAAGNYIITVRAIGSGGSTRSAPYAFAR